jgi:hypothetical protein
VEGSTVADATYACQLLEPVWAKGKAGGQPNPKGNSIDMCNGTNPYETRDQCKPTFSCNQSKAGPDDSQSFLQEGVAPGVTFDYTCTELPPATVKGKKVPNPAGTVASDCKRQCVKRFECDYSDDYTCKECDPCKGVAKGKCNPMMGQNPKCSQMYESCHYDPNVFGNEGQCQPSYSCEISHKAPPNPFVEAPIDFNYKCVEQTPGVKTGQFKKSCEEQVRLPEPHRTPLPCKLRPSCANAVHQALRVFVPGGLQVRGGGAPALLLQGRLPLGAPTHLLSLAVVAAASMGTSTQTTHWLYISSEINILTERLDTGTGG